MGYEKKNHTTFFKGGEREALRRLRIFLNDRSRKLESAAVTYHFLVSSAHTVYIKLFYIFYS